MTSAACAAVESESRRAERWVQPTAHAVGANDLAGRLLRVNRAFEKLTGYSAEELSTLTVADITAEHSLTAGREILDQIRATGISARYEKEYRRRDGTLVPVEVLADLDRDEHDRPIGFTGFMTDI